MDEKDFMNIFRHMMKVYELLLKADVGTIVTVNLGDIEREYQRIK